MKMLKVSLAAIAMLIAFQQPMDSKKVSGPETLKVVSFNIRNGEASDGTNSWIYRYPATALMIEDQKPDIMGLQEAYSYQVSFITENLLNYEAVGVGREDGRKEGEHMSILYNKKTVFLKKWGTFWLSDTPDEPSQGWDGACKRTATWALMKDKRSGNSFLYVNTHLDHVGKEAQKNGLALILSKIGEINKDNLPVILTGDFNVRPDDPVLTELDKTMKSARATAAKTDSHDTFNGWGKGDGVIDYIYYSGFSSCPEFETIVKKYADRQFISDHFPIFAVLEF